MAFIIESGCYDFTKIFVSVHQHTFHFNGFILRDASRSLSSGAHSRDPLALLPRVNAIVFIPGMRSETLMVRGASSRVSNHEATGEAAMIPANQNALAT